jgi:peptidoglycan hydrolase-like protein with peptidoglycan-binding domain
MSDSTPSNQTTYRPLILLQQGAVGTDVVNLQQLLKQKGFNPGPTDGYFGSRTHTAVYLFQFSRNLPLNGSVDLTTWEAIEATV